MKKLVYIILATIITFSNIIITSNQLKAKEINQMIVDDTIESIDDKLQNIIKNDETNTQENVLNREQTVDFSVFQKMSNEDYLIPDVQLRKIVNERLGKSGSELETYVATESELATIKNDFGSAAFEIISKNSPTDVLDIKSLEGLQYLTGVKQLRLQNIIIQEKDLSVISQMTWLEGLSVNTVIFGGGTGSTTPRLNISINGGPVQAITNIPIDQEIDLSPLGKLINLKYLYFTLNGLQQDAAYTYSHRTFYNLSGLSGLINIKEMYINDMGAVDDTSYEFIRALNNLEILSISRTPLEDVTAISTLENLKSLSINGTSVRDFRPIIDKSYFTGASDLKYNFDVQYYDKSEQAGIEMNAFNLDTGIITGNGIKNIGFTTISSHLGYFDIIDAKTIEDILNINFELKDMKTYSLLNYVTGLYDIKKLGFVFGANITTENGKKISYSINSITIGKKVTFNSNYTGGITKEVKFDPFEKITKPNDITREGQKIVDWFKDDQGTDVFDFNSDQNTNITLYAQWEANDYEITFDANGGEGTMLKEAYKYAEEKSLLKNEYTRVGYRFIGWSETATGDVVYQDETSYKFQKTNNVTLYAQWEANDYEITFDANGGEGTMLKEAYKYAEEKPLLKSEYTRVGYRFIGWSETATGDVVYQDETSYKFQKTNNVTLYAQWEANDYEITFDANGGEGTMLKESYKYDEEKPLLKSEYTRVGYRFIGWSETAIGDVVYQDETSYKFQKTNNVTLYAQWEANDYEITFDANGGEGTMLKEAYKYAEEKPLLKNEYTRVGYRFIGWSETATGDVVYQDETSYKFQKTNNVTLYAQWEANEDEITTNENETTTSENETTTSENETTNENPTNNLPRTGLSNTMSIFGGILLAIGSSLFIFKRKIKKE